jgi:hypothetical protein
VSSALNENPEFVINTEWPQGTPDIASAITDPAPLSNGLHSDSVATVAPAAPRSVTGTANGPYKSRGFLLLDLLQLFFQPGVFFKRLPRISHHSSALLLLILFQVLLGTGVLSTGVVEYELAVQTQQEYGRVAWRLDEEQMVGQADAALDNVEKEAVLRRLLVRLDWLVARPLSLLGGLLLTAALLFGLVSLEGRKANFSLLFAVAIYAAYALVFRMGLVLFLTWQKQTTHVEFSLAAWLSGRDVGLPMYLLLRRLEPFALWHWVLLGLGLWKTGQMSGRGAFRASVLLALLTAFSGAAVDFWTQTNLSRMVLGS